MEHKADVNAKTNYRWTTLHAAARKGHKAVVVVVVVVLLLVLLEQEADIDTNKKGAQS
jgi:hypothetical protein